MKFTLRDLFWLLLVVGLCCTWWLDHCDLTRYKRAIIKLQTLGFDMRQNNLLDPT